MVWVTALLPFVCLEYGNVPLHMIHITSMIIVIRLNLYDSLARITTLVVLAYILCMPQALLLDVFCFTCALYAHSKPLFVRQTMIMLYPVAAIMVKWR
jgi:hypothetical protein